MLNTEKEIIEVCKEQNKTIADLVMEEEIATARGKKTESDIREYLKETLKVMESSAMANLERATESKFNMIDGFAMAANEASMNDGDRADVRQFHDACDGHGFFDKRNQLCYGKNSGGSYRRFFRHPSSSDDVCEGKVRIRPEDT